MKIFNGPSTSLIFTVIVVGVLGLVMGQQCDDVVNLGAFICGITCDSTFSNIDVLSTSGETTFCFCKEKVGGSGKFSGYYFETTKCQSDAEKKCGDTTCPSGNLYLCDLNYGASKEKATKSEETILCACGTGIASGAEA